MNILNIIPCYKGYKNLTCYPKRKISGTIKERQVVCVMTSVHVDIKVCETTHTTSRHTYNQRMRAYNTADEWVQSVCVERE